MSTNTISIDTERHDMLREMLVRLRDETYERIREFRRDQEQESELVPGDEMDAARSSADVETHAGLIGRAEEKLKLLDDALTQLDESRYGVCLDCRDPIPIERLMAIPFALYCIHCQRKRNGAERRSSEGGTIPPYDQQWTPPDEMSEAPDLDYHSTGVGEDLSIRRGRAFGPEEERIRGITSEKAQNKKPRKRSR